MTIDPLQRFKSAKLLIGSYFLKEIYLRSASFQ
jgi:hypothetical protein